MRVRKGRIMNSKQLKISVDTPIYMLLVGMLAIQIATPLRINLIASFGTWIIVIATIAAFMMALFTQKIKGWYLLNIVVLVVCVLASMVCTFVWEYQGIVAAVSFLEIPLLVTAYSECKKKKIQKAIYTSYIILSIYYQYISVTPYAHIYYTKYGEVKMDFMTLGYANPNETAMYLTVCFFILVTLFLKLKNKITKFFVMLDILLISRLIFLTLSRTAILLMVLFIGICVVFRKKHLPSYIRRICFIAPILFLILTFLQRTLGTELLVLGETIETGRIDLYKSVFEKMNVLTVMFGQYDFYFVNLHNALWCIFATIGIVGTIVFYLLLYKRICEIHFRSCKANRIEVKSALSGLLCIVAYTSTEAAFLSTGGTFAVAFISLYLLSIVEA